VPAGQLVQTLIAIAEYVPAAQVVQLDEPVVAFDVPAPQLVQTLAPAAE